ncbi:transglutaminase family protein [Pelagicoccus enzymogenes]|uniref:transglutaminase family protein n=1 Tax=Pelagicoccus enzymogenes TaxID=2773457 RepID=UPI0028108163|nr:transglutaminase family protein [Pelagicoccus enzymogenes]MDQ8196824.1 transglutaminase family protein [Pelagicoccus enzymogenes]
MATLQDVPPIDLTTERRDAFRGLLDDPSPVVQKALVHELSKIGPAACAFLEEIVSGSNRMLALHAKRILKEVENANPSEEFRKFIRSQNYELETGAIMLCRVAYPEVTPAEICTQIDSIADRCRELIANPISPRERCVMINRVLFHEFGFRGNAEDYENPDNSFLNRVLETKKGLPISLSILYLLVAQRVGADLDPIAYPGHFLVGSFEEDLPFYIDAFKRGRFIAPGQLLDYSSGYLSVSQLGNLAPSPIREVLTRCCQNLANHYGAIGQESQSKLFASFVHDFQTAHSASHSK